MAMLVRSSLDVNFDCAGKPVRTCTSVWWSQHIGCLLLKKKKWWKCAGKTVCGRHMMIHTASMYVYACTHTHTHGHTLTAHLQMLWVPLLPFLEEGSGSCFNINSSRVCWIQGLGAVYDFSRTGPIFLFYCTEFSFMPFFSSLHAAMCLKFHQALS